MDTPKQDTEDNTVESLDRAWNRIEQAIGTLGALVRRETENQDALHRFEGYRAALAAIAENYLNQVCYDRQRPECLPTLSTLFNYGGPSADFLYQVVHLEPGTSYRVWGRRGDAELIDFHEVQGWFGHREETEPKISRTLTNRLFDELGIAFDDDGNFDFILSPDKHEGQWVSLDTNTSTLVVRQYFTDYSTQIRPTTIYFDKLNCNAEKESTILSAKESLYRLGAFANSLRDWEYVFTMTRFHDGDGDNKYKEFNFGDDVGASDQRYYQVRFNVKRDEAVIVKWTVPENCLYWSSILYNDSYELLNCVNRQTNLNSGLAKIGADRVLYFVISHRDPGIVNWLDPDGHQQGLMLTRTKGKQGKRTEGDAPTTIVVPFGEVMNHLPENIAKVTGEERAKSLAIRRRHFHLRENR